MKTSNEALSRDDPNAIDDRRSPGQVGPVDADERAHDESISTELVAEGTLDGRHLAADLGKDLRPPATADPVTAPSGPHHHWAVTPRTTWRSQTPKRRRTIHLHVGQSGSGAIR